MENVEAYPASSSVDENYNAGPKKSAMAGQMALELTENAQIVLKKRYLIKDDTGRPDENPEELFRRVALAIAQPDALYEGR